MLAVPNSVLVFARHHHNRVVEKKVKGKPDIQSRGKENSKSERKGKGKQGGTY